MRFDVGGVDHLRVCGSPVPGKLPEQVFPYAAPRPAHKAVIDRRRRTISFGAIAPAAATFEHVHDPADHAPVPLFKKFIEVCIERALIANLSYHQLLEERANPHECQPVLLALHGLIDFMEQLAEITAVLQGIFAKNCLFCESGPDFGPDDQRLRGKFPTFENSEFF